MKTLISTLWLGLLLVGLCGCKTTEITTVWKTSEPLPAQPFKRVMALVVNATPGERRAGEDALAAAIKTAQGIPAYTIIPDADIKDREKVRSILISENIDGAAVLRLVSSDRQTQVYTRPESSYYSGYGFYDSYRPYPLYTNQYTVTDTYIHAELSVYSVADEKLLWVGSSTTTNPDGVRDLVEQVSKAAAEELRKQGLIRQ